MGGEEVRTKMQKNPANYPVNPRETPEPLRGMKTLTGLVLDAEDAIASPWRKWEEGPHLIAQALNRVAIAICLHAAAIQSPANPFASTESAQGQKEANKNG